MQCSATYRGDSWCKGAHRLRQQYQFCMLSMALAGGGCVRAGHFRAIRETLGARAPDTHAYQKPLRRSSHVLVATATLPVVFQSVPPGNPWPCRARSLVSESVTAIMSPDA